LLKQVANLFEHIVNMLEQINDFLCAVKRHFSHVFSRLRTFTNSIIRSVSTESGTWNWKFTNNWNKTNEICFHGLLTGWELGLAYIARRFIFFTSLLLIYLASATAGEVICLWSSVSFAMFVTMTTVRENGYSYRSEIFAVDRKSYCDHAVKFARWQHL